MQVIATREPDRKAQPAKFSSYQCFWQSGLTRWTYPGEGPMVVDGAPSPSVPSALAQVRCKTCGSLLREQAVWPVLLVAFPPVEGLVMVGWKYVPCQSYRGLDHMDSVLGV